MRRFERLSALLVMMCITISVGGATAPWWDLNWRFRVPVNVSAGPYERVDKPVDLAINFTQVLTGIGETGTFDPNSLRIVEVNNLGLVIDSAVPFQFDQDGDYDPATKASGTLVFIASGTTPAAATRYYFVYFDLAGSSLSPPAIPAQIVLTDGVQDEGQSCYRIAVNGSTFYYQKDAAGFSSWLDANGNDWLSFDPTPGSGANGEYRGIPNPVFPEGHFHPGKTNAISTLVHQGPVKVTVRSVTDDDLWECLWEFYPHHATMTMVRADHNYWFLYEGTPGGVLEPDTDFGVRSDGTSASLATSWTGDLSGDEWVYFSDPAVDRSLFLAHHENDNATDSYYPMGGEGGMTVFGFGRDGINNYLSTTPQHFTIGMIEGTTTETSSKLILSAYKPLSTALGAAERISLTTPVLRSPVDGTVNTGTSVTLRWSLSASATSYRVQVGTDPLFVSGVVVDDSTVVDTSRVVSGLTNSTRYYWRVSARNSGGTSGYSTVWSYTTVVGVPVLEAPGKGVTGQATSGVLRWRKVGGAVGYQVQMGTDPSFVTGVLVNDSSVVDTVRGVSGLNYNTAYYWRVRARGVNGPGSYAAAWDFTTALGTVVLVSPANGATGQGTSVTLRWGKMSGAVTYHVQVGKDSGFAAGVVVNDSSITDTVRVVSGLENTTTYYWRVRTGGGSYSAVWRFSTVLKEPVLVSPGDRSVNQPTSVNLRWGKAGGATLYWVQLGTDSGMTTGLVKNDSTVVDTFRTVSGLLNGTQYYWRVQARNGADRSAFSGVWSFRTIGIFPSQVELVSPVNNAKVSGDSVQCVWRRSQPGVTRYWFELSMDSLFTFRSVDSMRTDTVKMVQQIVKGQPYWWRVKAENVEGWGPYSATGKFTVTTTGVDEGQGLPREYQLSQNYPNPFNPSTRITYSLPQESQVQLEVYNIVGEKVATLVEGVRSAGTHLVEFDGTNLSSGIYLYHLRVDGRMFVRKMALVR